MNPTIRFGLILGILLLSSAPVMAQDIFPYQTGGVGISLGYRQAILNDHILGNRPSTLVRGPFGGLLDFERDGNQIFLKSPDSGAFLPGVRANSGWTTGLGTGLGWGGTYLAGPAANYFTGFWSAGNSPMSWIAMLPAGERQSYWDGFALGVASSPIDAWIQQL